MGWKQRVFLTSSQVYVCKNCKTHLTTKEDVISKDFNGRLGQANLVNQVFNLEEGILKERQMRTGKHVVRDVYCSRCRTYVGWKYYQAFVSTEKYKEGKFIVESAQLDEL